MEIQIEEGPVSTVFYVSGRLDASNAPVLQKRFMDAFENGARHLVADLDKTEYLSSAGISAMFYAQKKVSVLGAGASFDIVNVSMGIKEIFDITGFSKFFSITVKDDVK